MVDTAVAFFVDVAGLVYQTKEEVISLLSKTYSYFLGGGWGLATPG